MHKLELMVRDSKYKTPNAFAKAWGRYPALLYRIFLGKRSPTVDETIQIAKLLQVDPLEVCYACIKSSKNADAPEGVRGDVLDQEDDTV